MEQKNIYPSVMQAVYLLVSFLLLAIATTVFQKVFLSNSDVNNYFLDICRTFAVGGVILIFAYSRRKRGDKHFRFPFNRIDVKLCFWMVLIAPLLSYFVGGIVLLICMAFSDFIPDMSPLSSVSSINIYTVINVACVAPLLEELLFRGVILDGFLRRYSSFKAIFLSALFFAVLHYGPQIATAMLLGLLAGYVYYYTGSIWACIILHGVNNLCASLIIYCTGETSVLLQSAKGLIAIGGGWWILNLILLLLILYRFRLFVKAKYNPCTV